jgi:hypothetical protein
MQEGNHKVEVKVMDGKGGFADQVFTVTVQNLATIVKPRCIIDSILGNTLKGKVMIEGTSIPVGSPITLVQLRVDNGDWHSTTGQNSWKYELDTTKLKNGIHLIEVRAFDGANYSDITPVSVIVDNPPIQVSPGNDLWLIFPAVVLLVVVIVGLFFRT